MKKRIDIKQIIRKYIISVVYKVCAAVIINILTSLILRYIERIF